MTDALRAEWTKLRTSPSTAWILLAIVVLTAGLSTLVTGTIHVSGQSLEDPTKISLIGVDLGQAIVAVLGVLVISEEYGTRMIRTTLAAIPRRMTVLGAKAVNLIVLSAVASALGVAGSLVAGRLLLSHAGLGEWVCPHLARQRPDASRGGRLGDLPRAHRLARPWHRGGCQGHGGVDRCGPRSALPLPDPRGDGPRIVAPPPRADRTDDRRDVDPVDHRPERARRSAHGQVSACSPPGAPARS